MPAVRVVDIVSVVNSEQDYTVSILTQCSL